MRNSERMKAESFEIQRTMSTPGMKVILSEVDKRIGVLQSPVSFDENNWDYRTCDKNARAAALRELRDWILGKAKPKPDPHSPSEA